MRTYSALSVALHCLLALGATAASGCDDAAPAPAASNDGPTTFAAADPSRPWVYIPGKAFDVQHGGTDGSLWVLGAAAVTAGGDHALYRYQNGTWIGWPGHGVAFAVNPDNTALCVVNSNQDIYYGGVTSGWWQMPGKALDVAIGGNGSIWVVGTDHNVYRWNGSGWSYLQAYADKIAIEGSDRLWVINPWGIYILADFNASSWWTLPGQARDIGIGADGTAFVVGTDPQAPGFSLYTWTGTGWVPVVQAGVAGAGVNVAADPYGRAVIVNNAGDIFLQGDTAVPVAGGVYEFVSQGSSRCMAITNQYTHNGASMVQWDCLGSANFRFKATPVGGGYFNFVSTHSGKCLDIAGYGTGNGAIVQQWDCWGGDNQKFRVVSQANGFYTLVAKHSGRCVDVYAFSTANGAGIVQWDCLGGTNQAWKLKRVPTSGVIAGVAVGGAGVSCNYDEPIPGVYDLSCGTMMSVKGLKGYINSNTSFSLDGPVGNLKGALPGLAPLVNFVDSQILSGLDTLNVHVDGPDQGSHLRIMGTVGFGAGFTPLLDTINNLFGVNLAALKPFVTIEIEQGQVVIDAVIYNGPRVEKEIPEIGTAFALNSLTLRFKSTEGEKALTVKANAEIKVTSADNWVPAQLELVRTMAGGIENIVASGTFANWNKPLGFVPVDVKEATLVAGFTNRVLSAYRIDMAKVWATAGGVTYTLSGEYAVDRPNKLFYFGLNTPKVPLLIAVQMLAGADPNLTKLFTDLKLDAPLLQAYNGKNATIAFSPTGGTILGKAYEQKSYVYGQLAFAGLGAGAVPANFDATADIKYDSGSKKYTVGDFSAKVNLDLIALTNSIKQQSSAAAGILNVFKLKTVSVDVKRVNNVVSGGASATLRACGVDQTIGFDTSNLLGLVDAGIKFVGGLVTACTNNAVCPAGYNKVGAQCDKPCPAFFNASPGLCTHSTQQCWNPTTGYIFPNCKNPGTCAQFSVATDGILGKNDLCTYKCEHWPGMSGALPSCINNDSAKPLTYPE